MIRIVPSILTNNLDKAKDLIGLCEGVVDMVSIDIIDGTFADNKTIRPVDLKGIKTDLLLDFQLMVNEPIDWVEECAGVDAYRIIGHVEKMSSQKKFIDKVKEQDIKVGLALDLKTPVAEIENDTLKELDAALIMSVPAGFGGQEFDQKALKKIEQLRDIKQNLELGFVIHDDGGVTLENVDDTHFIGAGEVSVGRRIFKGDLHQNLLRYQKAAHVLEMK